LLELKLRVDEYGANTDSSNKNSDERQKDILWKN
jgi:hypothetical protein